MQVKADKVTQALEKGLEAVYLVSGDELLIVQETCDQIVKVARSEGFTERLVYQLGVDGGWDGLREETSDLSLLSTRRVIDVRMPASKLEIEASG